MRRRFLALAAAAALAWTTPAQAGPFSALYAFGDSLSDVGNIFTATGGAIPGPPYANGQFSNGPVWLQGLAAGLGLAPLTPSLQGGTNYAFGLANTGQTPTHALQPIDVLGTLQFGAFTAAHPAGAPADALYAVWAGSNDLIGALTAGPSVNPLATADAAVANLRTLLSDLADAGARSVLLATVPDLGLTPRLSGTAAQQAATALSAYFNAALRSVVDNDPDLAALDVRVLDIYALINDAVNQGAYGFANVTDACLVGAVNFNGGTPCANPDDHLFWDDLHPTARAHAIIGQQALALVTAVPEPGSLVLLVVGAAAATWTRRRQAA